MANKVFIDTNVFLNATFVQQKDHLVCQQWLEKLASHEDTELWINGQVIREFLCVATKMKSDGEELSLGEIHYHLNRYLTLCHIADETPAVRENLLCLWRTLAVRGVDIHDTNIVATMLANDITVLFTLDNGFNRYLKYIMLLAPIEDACLLLPPLP